MLRDKDVYLAPLAPDDAPVMFSWINERSQVLLNSNYKPVAYRQHMAWFESVTGREGMVIFAIRLTADQSLIGSCQLHSIDAVSRCAELQIRLGEVKQRGRGYGQQAVRLLLAHAFKDLNLERVYLQVITTNEPAIRVYEKAGFQREGCLRRAAHIDGRYVDLYVMAVLREEYEAS